MSGELEKPRVPQGLAIGTRSAEHDGAHVIEHAAQSAAFKILEGGCQTLQEGSLAFIAVDADKQATAVGQDDAEQVNSCGLPCNGDGFRGPVHLHFGCRRSFEASFGSAAS